MLYYILYHFIIIVFKLVAFLIIKQLQTFEVEFHGKYSEILVNFLENFLYLQDLFDVYFDILGACWLIFAVFILFWRISAHFILFSVVWLSGL